MTDQNENPQSMYSTEGRHAHERPIMPGQGISPASGSPSRIGWIIAAVVGGLGLLAVLGIGGAVAFLFWVRSPAAVSSRPPSVAIAHSAGSSRIASIGGSSSGSTITVDPRGITVLRTEHKTPGPPQTLLDPAWPGAADITECQYEPGVARTPDSEAFHRALLEHVFSERGAQAERDLRNVERLLLQTASTRPDPDGDTFTVVLLNGAADAVTISGLYEPHGAGGWTFAVDLYDAP